jgi:hypothetical protein
MQLQLRGSLREGASHARPAWIFRSTTSRCTSFISGHRYNRRHWRKWTRVRSKVQRNSAKLFQWFAFCGASGAGNEVSHAFLSPRIMEWIIQVLGSVSRGVMEKHALNADGPLVPIKALTLRAALKIAMPAATDFGVMSSNEMRSHRTRERV